ncbi:MAG: DUF1080 domain-containing protein [Flammeovirgaceae bacterium]|nr:DUF1080 domain-containing protein [Flammeovirgaceae bacterium]
MEKRRIIAFILIGILNAISVSANDGDWKPLFNGKNFKGWKVLNGTAEYTIDNGEVVGTSAMNTPNTFLTTKTHYGDFILEYEMKMDRGLNSGVQIRSNSIPEYKDGRIHGYQVECDDSERRWAGGIYDEARRGWLYPLEYNKEGKKAFKNGEWNKYRIEAVGNSIRTWINGIPCSNLMVDFTASGFIGLQVHSIHDEKHAGKTIRWKNIRIKTENLESDRKKMKGVREVSYLNNQLTETEKAEGWKLLWDGETTKGWRSAKSDKFPEAGWEIKDGMLSVIQGDGKESVNGGDIISEDKYKSFILEVDFKLSEGGNSGIKYLVDPELNKGTGSAIGPEFQILDDKKHPDAKLGVAGYRTLASLYDLIPADGRLFDPNLMQKRFNGINSWNRARVEVRGNNVQHFLNGVKVLEYERGTQQWKALVGYSKYAKWPNFGELEQGHILLQEHGDKVDFRNVKIKTL